MATQTTHPISTKAAYTVAVGGGLFAGLLLLLHFIKPELNPTWRFISEYAIGDAGWLMTLAFLSLAVACIAGIRLFWNQAQGWLGRIGSVLLGVTAIGLLLGALFVTDPITTPMDQLTTTGKLHNLGGQLNLNSFAILFLTISLTRKAAWKPMKRPLWIVTAVCLLVDVAFVVSAVSANGAFGPDVYAGLFGRMLMLTFTTWMVIAGVYAAKLGRKSSI